jgi:hypothetical protein
LLFAAWFAPAVAEAPSAGASSACPTWKVSDPYAGFGVIGADGSATCVNTINFGDE